MYVYICMHIHYVCPWCFLRLEEWIISPEPERPNSSETLCEYSVLCTGSKYL